MISIPRNTFGDQLRTANKVLSPPSRTAIGLDYAWGVATDGEFVVVRKTGYYDDVAGAYVYHASSGDPAFSLTTSVDTGIFGNSPIKFDGAVAAGGGRYYAATSCFGCSLPAFNAVHVFDRDGAHQGFLHASDGTRGDSFGWPIAVVGDQVLVGAISADGPVGARQGAAYLFDALNRTQIKKFTAEDGDYSGDFASALAFDSQRTLIGGYAENVGAGIYGGRVFVFDTTNGEQLRILQSPQQTNSAGFGAAVGLYKNIAVIGDTAWNASLETDFGGGVHLFDLVTGDFLRTITPIDENGLPAGGSFGHSLAVSEHYLVVGAPSGESRRHGRAYLYDLNTFEQVAILIGNEEIDDLRNLFGYSVAIANGTAVVGSPYGSYGFGEAHVFAIVPEPHILSSIFSIAALSTILFRRPFWTGVRHRR